MPLRRVKPLRRSLQQVASEVLGEQRASQSSKQRRTSDRSKDATWRKQVLALRGSYCRATAHLTLIHPAELNPAQRKMLAECGATAGIEIDHMIPRRPSTRWAVPNGLPLCRVHHAMKTAHDLLIDPAWLDDDQILWLSDQGHAEWLLDGVVVGAHRRLFADGPDRRRE